MQQTVPRKYDTNTRPRSVSVEAARSVFRLLVLVLCVCGTGCGMFGSSKQVQQLRLENDRLLSEYRAQRDRLSALQETNAALEARLGESEKLLARLGQSTPTSRISRADVSSQATPPSLLPYDYSSRSNLNGTRNLGGNASGGNTPAEAIPGANVDPLQWRPLRRQ